MIKEIIFDCFGVLTQDGWTKFVQTYGNAENLDELRYANKGADKGILSQDEFMSSICSITGATKKEALSILVNGYHPESNVFELIKRLKPNYKIGLISNISSPIENYLPTAPLDLFEEQTLSYQNHFVKPQAQIFELHLNKTGTKPEEAVFIDDREVNSRGAEEAGLHGIWYKDINQLKAELTKLGVKV